VAAAVPVWGWADPVGEPVNGVAGRQVVDRDDEVNGVAAVVFGA
jgi:hypothetical protein